jgi:hypothetical protein
MTKTVGDKAAMLLHLGVDLLDEPHKLTKKEKETTHGKIVTKNVSLEEAPQVTQCAITQEEIDAFAEATKDWELKQKKKREKDEEYRQNREMFIYNNRWKEVEEIERDGGLVYLDEWMTIEELCEYAKRIEREYPLYQAAILEFDKKYKPD